MARARTADLDASLTSWFGLKSRRRLTLGGDGGSVMFVRFRSIEKDVRATSPSGGSSWCKISWFWVPKGGSRVSFDWLTVGAAIPLLARRCTSASLRPST
jgi:hypothetical protein